MPSVYLRRMSKFEFCLPTTGKIVPSSPEWFHEIKYDGYRLRVERDGDRVRLITRGGYDWSKRYPWIAEAALKNRAKQFVIDGEAVNHRYRTKHFMLDREAVVPCLDDLPDFSALHSGKHEEVQFCTFDILALDGENPRNLPLSMRKSNSKRLLRARLDGA